MAVELKGRSELVYFLATLLALIAVVVLIGRAQPQVVVQVPQVQQPQVVQPTTTPTVEYSDTATVAVYVMDPEANPTINGFVQIWRVYNESNVTSLAFYATEGYSVWLNSSLDELGSAVFTITRVQYDILKQMIQQGKLALYAVFIPGEGASYYREGVKLPEISFVKGKETTTVIITVKAIAQYYDLYDVTLDIRGLTSGTEKSRTFNIMTVSDNEKGIFRVYKFVINPVELANVVDQFSELKLTIAGKEVVLITGGQLKVNESTEVVIPVKEMKAGDSISMSVYYKLASNANAAYDGKTLVKVGIVDVRGVSLGEVSVTLDTA